MGGIEAAQLLVFISETAPEPGTSCDSKCDNLSVISACGVYVLESVVHRVHHRANFRI